MRRSWQQVLLPITAALALLAVILSAIALATARNDDKTLTSLTDTKALNLHFTRDFITLASVESNPKDSPGDQLIIYTNLVGDTVTGKEAQVCTVLKADKPPRFETTMFQCLETIQLKDGQLTGQQLTPENKTSTNEAEATFAITGGTGAYKQAHGFGLFTDDGKTLDLHMEYLPA
jgi:hypothetical protein